MALDTQIDQVLSSEAPSLVNLAREARRRAYAPYSKFNVGAAVVDRAGNFSLGVNVENSSYGLTVCAERIAVFNAVANGSRSIAAIAISAASEGGCIGSAMPCGACLQVLSEFMSPDGTVEIDGGGIYRLRELLPQPFKL